MLNLRLMSHWQNWLFVLLVFIGASFALNSISKVILKEDA